MPQHNPGEHPVSQVDPAPRCLPERQSRQDARSASTPVVHVNTQLPTGTTSNKLRAGGSSGSGGLGESPADPELASVPSR